MPLRVAFDLDGTVADMHAAMARVATEMFANADPSGGPSPDSASPNAEGELPSLADLNLTARQQAQLWNRVRKIENFWAGLPETEPGIIARIAQTAAARRWDVLFITTRPSAAGETTQLQSQRWLEAHGFPLPSCFVVTGSRGKVAEALTLDAVVDDRPENCLDVAVESKAKSILVWTADPRGVPPGAARIGVKVARSIGEAVDLLEKLDDLRADRGLAGSIRKIFKR
jgi:beta-phosphoglucomutase-like phosphatase (HAD superfamily)